MKINRNKFLPAYKERPPVSAPSLAFIDGELESEFLQYYTANSIRFVRIVLLLAVFLIMMFAVLDYVNLTNSMSRIMSIRAVMSIFIVGCIFYTFTDKSTGNLQFMLSAVVIVAGLGIIMMIGETSDIGGQSYYAALILAIMYAHGLLRLRFIYASITTWGIIGVYLMASLFLMNPDTAVVINNIFFLISANIMGMFTSYWIEFYIRNSFWQSKQLEKKTDELKSEYKRKSAELNSSRLLQLDMLPASPPVHPDYECSFYMSTASEIGGDYYDYLMDSDQRITGAIGDATGHGARAGAMVTAIKILFLEHAENSELAEFMNHANETIRRIGFNKLYMSFAVFRIEGDLLTIAGAGLPAGLLYRAASGQHEQLELKGLPLGSPVNYRYREQQVRLFGGDILMLMTDGFPELFNEEKSMYGYENVSRLFRKHAPSGAQMIMEQFKDSVSAWLNGTPQNDDITFILFQKKNRSSVISEAGQ